MLAFCASRMTKMTPSAGPITFERTVDPFALPETTPIQPIDRASGAAFARGFRVVDANLLNTTWGEPFIARRNAARDGSEACK